MDISYKVQHNDKNYRFNNRVAAIIETDAKILLHKDTREDYWYLPGGRVKIGETAHDAIIRELQEELNIKVVVSSVPFIVENFFKINEEEFHEICFIFKINVNGLKLPSNEEIVERTHFIWKNQEEIQNINLKPEFLKQELRSISNLTKHIIFNEL